MGETEMSRKAFLIWGLAIITLGVLSVGVLQFLGLSKIIDLKAVLTPYSFAQLLLPIIGFGILLHLRFKEIGRRKRTLALCLIFYILSMPYAGILSLIYNDLIFENSSAQTRFYEAIGEWARQDNPKAETPWSFKHKIDYILAMMPMHILSSWNLFALLWFGSLDPRTPSKGRFAKFVKPVLGRDEVTGNVFSEP
jgi:hypothetical protein